MPTHVYPTTGIKTIIIRGTAWSFSGITNNSGRTQIVSVSSFLDSLTDLSNLFSSQPAVFAVPVRLPPNVTNLQNMFTGASGFNGNIDGWNTSTVTNMNFMFQNTGLFNQPLTSWNTAAVTNMRGMFAGAAAFNQSLNSWTVTALTTAESMFANGAFLASIKAKWPNFASNPTLANKPDSYYTT
jgi:surface protein